MTGESNTGIHSARPQQVEPKLFNGAVAPEQTDQETQDTPSGVSNTAISFQSTFPFRFGAPCSTQGNNPPAEPIPHLFAPTPLRTNIASFLPTPEPSLQTDFADRSKDDEFAAEPETFMGEEERVDGEDEQYEGTEDNNEEQEDETEDLAEDEDDSSDLSDCNDDDEDEDNSDDPGDGGASSASSPNNGTNDDASFSDHDSGRDDRNGESGSNAGDGSDGWLYTGHYGLSKAAAGPAGFGATLPKSANLPASPGHTTQKMTWSTTTAYIPQVSPNYGPGREIKPTVNTYSYSRPAETPVWSAYTGPFPPGMKIAAPANPQESTGRRILRAKPPRAAFSEAAHAIEAERGLRAAAQSRRNNLLRQQALERYYEKWLEDPDPEPMPKLKEDLCIQVARALCDKARAEGRKLEAEIQEMDDNNRYDDLTGTFSGADDKLSYVTLQTSILAEASSRYKALNVHTPAQAAPQQSKSTSQGQPVMNTHVADIMAGLRKQVGL